MTLSLRTFLSAAVILSVTFIPFFAAHAERLTLSDGIRMVTEDNMLVKIRKQDELISESDTLIARSGLLPHVYGTYSQNYNEKQQGTQIQGQSAYTQQQDFYAFSLRAQQLLWDFKGVLSIYEASKKIQEARHLEYKRTRNYVALSFALGYFDLLESEKMITVSEKETEMLSAHLTMAKNLYTEGVITKNDLLQADVRLSDARQKLLAAKNIRKITASRLNTMLGRPLSSVLDPEEIPVRAPEPPIDLNWAMAKAEKDRYEIRMVDVTVDAIKFEEAAKKAEYYPRFFVEGGYNYLRNKYALYDGSWSVMGGMSINLFSGGATLAGLDKIRREKDKLTIERRKLIDDIRFEVERYYLELTSAREKVRVTKDATSQAEENLRINRVKYREGEGTATDVVDAITLLTVAETNHFRSQYELLRAEANLIHAMGRDLVEVYKELNGRVSEHCQ
ncbi:MAG TPA: TolC family protein [Syntrophorhabdus sp.]|nr:TolC family protein [Syntrophorhabdus sp.]